MFKIFLRKIRAFVVYTKVLFFVKKGAFNSKV